MDQWLMPLTASIVCKEGGLPQDKSIALTAAALVLQGPMAIAPAIVAVEEQKRRAARGTGETPRPVAQPPRPVGPALVVVPDVVGTDEAKARATLGAAKLAVQVRYVRSDAGAKDKVIVQEPGAGAGSGYVDEGSRVRLAVGAGPAEAPPPDDRTVIAALKADVDARMDALAAQVASMTGLLQELKATMTAPSPPAPSPPAPSPGGDTSQKPPKG